MRLSSKVIRAIGWDTAGNTVVSALSFLTTVWLVRYLGPEGYGLLAALLATVGLGQLLANGGVRTALLRFVPEALDNDGPGAAARLVGDAMLMRTAFVLAVSAPLWVFPEFVAATLIGRPALAPYLSWTPLLIALPLYADVLASVLLAAFRQRTVRSGEVVNKVVFAGCLLLLPLWENPIFGVIFAWTAGWACGGVWMIADARQQGFIGRPAGGHQHGFKRLGKFIGAAYGLSLIAFVLGRELDILLLSRFGLPDDALALYAVAFAFVHLAYRVFLLPITGGFDGPLIASLYVADDWPGLRRLFRAYFEYIFIFVLPIASGGFVLGSDIVREVYGTEYRDAGPIVITLLIALGLAKVCGITGPFMLGTDREAPMLRIRAAFSLVNIAAAMIAIPVWGVTGAALATCLTLTGMTVFEAAYVNRYLRAPYPWTFLGRAALSALVMGAIVAGLRSQVGSEPGLIALLAIVSGGALAYGAMLLLLRPVDPEQAEILARAGAPSLARLVRTIARPTPKSPYEATDQAGRRQEL